MAEHLDIAGHGQRRPAPLPSANAAAPSARGRRPRGDGTLPPSAGDGRPGGGLHQREPHAASSAASAIPATPPASPSPVMATPAAVISRRPRPTIILIAAPPII